MKSKRSTSNKSSERSDGRKGLFSSFARLSDTPPAVDVSRGAPFEVDVEKNLELDSVSDRSGTQSLSTDSLYSPCPRIANEWLRSEDRWKAFRGGLRLRHELVMGICRCIATVDTATKYRCSELESEVTI